MKKRTEAIQINVFDRYVILVKDDSVTAEEAVRVQECLTEWWEGKAKFFVLSANTDAEVTFERISQGK